MPLSLVKGAWVEGVDGDNLGSAVATWDASLADCDRVLILPGVNTVGMYQSPLGAKLTILGVEHFCELPVLLDWNSTYLNFIVNTEKVETTVDPVTGVLAGDRPGFRAVVFNSEQGLLCAPLWWPGVVFDPVSTYVK